MIWNAQTLTWHYCIELILYVMETKQGYHCSLHMIQYYIYSPCGRMLRYVSNIVFWLCSPTLRDTYTKIIPLGLYDRYCNTQYNKHSPGATTFVIN